MSLPGSLPLRLLLTLCLLTLACGSQEETVNPEDRLCRAESGFGARVSGGGQTVDVCVADSRVNAVYTQDGYYEVIATMQANGKTHEFRMTFGDQANYPLTLNLTGNLAQALSDPMGAWMFYEETPDGGDALLSSSVTGTFTLGFSGQNVVTGTMTDVTIVLENSQNQSDAGTRTISEGYFSISVTQQ